MSSTPVGNQVVTEVPRRAAIDLKLEVIAIPVADVDRAKAFYEKLGWSLDADFKVGKTFRAVQLTPPGSPCSIHLNPAGVPGSAKGMFLVVSDIEAARREIIAKGVAVSDVFHYDGDHQPVPGLNPERQSYGSYATFDDPDGNRWVMQEVRQRLPGRGLSLDVATLTGLLRDAETGHGAHGSSAPKHHWSEWYAGYIVARERGRTADEAAQDATRHIGGAN
jgi:predicted enzyme related to lactoylglutathione lyase